MAHVSVDGQLAPNQDGMEEGHDREELLAAWQTGSREIRGGARKGNTPFWVMSTVTCLF